MEQPTQEWRSAQIDLNATGDKASIPVPFPVKVVRIGLVMQSADTGDATIKFDKRVTAGSDTSRVSAGVGTLTKAGSSLSGKYLYKKITDSTSVELDCGDEIVVNVTAENCSANAFAVAVVEYKRLQENPLNLSDATASA